jgi:hypothetical protein
MLLCTGLVSPDGDRVGLDRRSHPQPVMRAPGYQTTADGVDIALFVQSDTQNWPQTCACGSCSSATPLVPDWPDPGTGILTLDLTPWWVRAVGGHVRVAGSADSLVHVLHKLKPDPPDHDRAAGAVHRARADERTT